MSGGRQVAVARVGALYDIHGNLPALEVVLEAIREAMNRMEVAPWRQ